MKKDYMAPVGKVSCLVEEEGLLANSKLDLKTESQEGYFWDNDWDEN